MNLKIMATNDGHNKSLHWPPDASVTALVLATAAPDTGDK